MAGLAGAVLVLSACGGGGGSGDGSIDVATGVRAEKLIAASADKAEQAGTARMKGGVTIDGAAVPKATHFEMDGVVDFRSTALEFRMDLGSALGRKMPGFAMKMRQVDGVSYLGFDAEARAASELSELTHGKQWIKVDPAAMGVPQGSGGDTNPGSTMDALRGITDPKPVGSEKIRGVDTTHYRGTIDVSKAADLLPDDSGVTSTLRDMFGQAWGADVWVDADGQTRKMRMEIDGRLHMVEEFEFYDFGVPVDLTAPPANEVADFQDVFGSLIPGGAAGLRPAA